MSGRVWDCEQVCKTDGFENKGAGLMQEQEQDMNDIDGYRNEAMRSGNCVKNCD
jgi:hypothetical protein